MARAYEPPIVVPADVRADDDDLLDQQQVADVLSSRRANGTRVVGVSPRTLEYWRTHGGGPRFVKLGRRVMYRRGDVRRWIDQQTKSFTHEGR